MFRALIVEDNPVFRRSLHELLERRYPFMRIAEAGDGEEALHQVASQQPDLVLTDVRLAPGSGLDVTQVVKATHGEAIVCVIAACDSPESRDAALRSGADHFLVRSGSTEAQIAAVVDSILAARVKTLIIEDDASFRRALDEILSARWPSMVVDEAEDGPDGLEHVAALKPDVVLLDLRLPSASGLDLVGAIRARHGDSVIVIVTAYDLPEYREAASRAGVPHFIAKTEAVADEVVEIVNAILSSGIRH